MSGSCTLLGVRVDALTAAEVGERISSAIAGGDRRLLGAHNLHSVYLYQRNPHLRTFYGIAHDVPIDSMALVGLARLLRYPVGRRHRTTSLDWIDSVLDKAVENQWRIFYFGSRPGVVEDGARAWRTNHPGLQIATAHGYIESGGKPANDELLAKIRAFSPHILMVGLGQPRQEKWIVENWQSVDASVVLMAGALIDYAAGAIPMPPRWLGRIGFEWLFRLCSEPRWLWRRYLVEPWFLVGLFARDLAGRLQGRQPRVE